MPNRLIYESIGTSESVAKMSDFQFRLWVGLIVMADDFGNGDARPAIIKGRVFPLRDRVTVKDIDTALHGLAAIGCVSLYEVGGKPYYTFPTWANYQRVRNKIHKIPTPDESDAVFADCGELPQVAADCGELPLEFNPIQSESESEKREPAPVRGFDDFYAAYPRKIDRKEAQRAWEKIKPDADMVDAILAGLEEWKASEEWSDKQFIPHPTTWLNRRRWESHPMNQNAGKKPKNRNPALKYAQTPISQKDFDALVVELSEDDGNG